MHVLRVLALAAIVMAAFPLRADASDIRQGSQVIIGPNDTIDDDLYAFATTVTISGTVNGDVIAAGKDQHLPAALVIGGPPVVAYAAVQEVPYGIDELSIAAGLAGEAFR